MRARLLGTITLLILALLILVTVVVIGPEAAGSAEPSASPSATATPSPTATPTPPASAETVAKALKARDRAKAFRRSLCRVRACFGAHMPVRVAPRPDRAACEETWQKAGKRWRGQAGDWRAKTAAGVAKMRHPGGSGAARWWPAARHCGWPERLKGWFCYVVWRESSARPHAVNSSSGCYGLLQLHPCHWASKGRAWIRDVFNQLRLGWKLYRECGASPWAL